MAAASPSAIGAGGATGRAVGGGAALVETVLITLVAGLWDGAIAVAEFVFAASGGRVCELSGFFDC